MIMSEQHTHSSRTRRLARCSDGIISNRTSVQCKGVHSGGYFTRRALPSTSKYKRRCAQWASAAADQIFEPNVVQRANTGVALCTG